MAWIAGEHVILRAWERDDVRRRWESEQTPDATEPRLRDWHEPPRSLQQREVEFDAQAAEPDSSVVELIIEVSGEVVGDINLFDVQTRNRCCRVGLSIWRASDRGRGYGGDALRALLRWAFREFNMHRVELSVDPSNERAIRLYERLGFAREGVRREAHYDDGRFIDDVVMGLLDREFDARDAARSADAQVRSQSKGD
jgi:RimJ/RimL family protein N-acetyltransferase